MRSERKGPMSRVRPEAAAEQSEDRVRTQAKPEALDSGTGELCVVQEAASKADPTAARAAGTAHPPDRRCLRRPAGRDLLCALAQRLEERAISSVASSRPPAATHVQGLEAARATSGGAARMKKGRSPMALHQSALNERRRPVPGDDQVIEQANVEERQRGL
jgi:hypothetical protein